MARSEVGLLGGHHSSRSKILSLLPKLAYIRCHSEKLQPRLLADLELIKTEFHMEPVDKTWETFSPVSTTFSPPIH